MFNVVRRAGLVVHDLGRLGDLTERILASSPTLAPLGSLAVEHHERLDGSGYPRGLIGNI